MMKPPLPTGAVTFLFTGIEGSTRLWQEKPEAMAISHAHHEPIRFPAPAYFLDARLHACTHISTRLKTKNIARIAFSPVFWMVLVGFLVVQFIHIRL